MKPTIICLMGPTASGKTSLAIEMVQHFPCEIISVDSAMVYKGMDIGTAKPSPEILAVAPHRLIDLLDPSVPYSAGQFRSDALREIADIHAKGKIPLLVGGTMMYFRILQQGIAQLPRANPELRRTLHEKAENIGWEALHAELASCDPQAAARIHPNDSQRIQRALEVYHLTGKPISTWQAEETAPLADYHVINLAIAPTTREGLHQRIAERLAIMFASGFVEEVKRLYARGDLNPDLPSIRSVGYSQVWEYLAGKVDESTMEANALVATRQLAKRQLTWLRSWPELHWLRSEGSDLLSDVSKLMLPNNKG